MNSVTYKIFNTNFFHQYLRKSVLRVTISGSESPALSLTVYQQGNLFEPEFPYLYLQYALYYLPSRTEG